MLHSPLFFQLLILFGAVASVTTVCHYLHLPSIIGFLLAGILVGPSGFGLVSSLPNADHLAEIAAIFLMFTIGLEFSLKRLIRLRREFFRLGLAQVVLTTAIVSGLAVILWGTPFGQSVFFGFLVALSSTALVMKLLHDARDLDTPYGTSSLSILLLQDIVVIPMMLMVPLLAAGGSPSLSPLRLNWFEVGALKTVLLVVLVMAGLWIAARSVIPFLLDRIVATRSREVFFFFVLFLCLGVAYLFQGVGLSLSLGAFAAGLIISESPYGRQVTADILPLRDNFLGIFFASVGMLLDIRFVMTHLGQVILLGAAGFTIKCLVLTIVGKLNKLPLSLSAAMGLILCQIGEFSFILASRGQSLGLLGDREYQYFLSLTVLSMAATPFLYRLTPFLIASSMGAGWRVLSFSREASLVRQKVMEERQRNQQNTNNHAIIIGFGISGENVAAAFQTLKIPFKVIELNHQTFKSARKKGIDIFYGDATRPDVLEHTGLGTAKLVVVAVSGAKMLPQILSAIRHVRPDVQVIIRTQYVRDVDTLPKEPQTEIVVGEIETSIEILVRSLAVYGVGYDDIKKFSETTRQELHNLSQIKASLKTPGLELPSWEAIGAIRPLRLDERDFAIGRSLGDLDVRRLTGAMVVGVFREGLGSTVPGSDFVLGQGDVLQIMGSRDVQERGEHLLRHGPRELVDDG